MSDTQNDPTEAYRRAEVERLNAIKAERAELEARYGKVWSTDEVREDFEVLGFMAPFVMVERRLDQQRGTLMFQHSPRYYFDWSPT
jgi:hypothetical protein